jgi:glycosyltransferase involved in cell wall biosynthesis
MIKISLCMIVKNEEDNLDHCLSSIAKHMDEIVIVDTGSSDGTKEIAQKYTHKVYDYKWRDDFSAARNFSISKASNDYILVLDSDEFIQSIDINEVKRLIENNPFKIGRILLTNEYTRKGNLFRFQERLNRLFPKEYYRYKGIIHEQITLLDSSKGRIGWPDDANWNTTVNLPISVLHVGYEGDLEVRRKKTSRNISLLEKALQQNENDPYILYQLGKSYYMEEDYNKACNYFEQALSLELNPKLEYVQDMVESYGYTLINTEQYETALGMLNIYDEFSHSADFVFLVALILMNNGKINEAIDEFKKATHLPQAKMEGINDYLSYYNIGVIYDCLEEYEKAKYYYLKCGNFEAARMRLKELIE